MSPRTDVTNINLQNPQVDVGQVQVRNGLLYGVRSLLFQTQTIKPDPLRAALLNAHHMNPKYYHPSTNPHCPRAVQLPGRHVRASAVAAWSGSGLVGGEGCFRPGGDGGFVRRSLEQTLFRAALSSRTGCRR